MRASQSRNRENVLQDQVGCVRHTVVGQRDQGCKVQNQRLQWLRLSSGRSAWLLRSGTTVAAAELDESCTGGTGLRLSIVYLGRTGKLMEVVNDYMNVAGVLMAEREARSSASALQRIQRIQRIHFQDAPALLQGSIAACSTEESALHLTAGKRVDMVTQA